MAVMRARIPRMGFELHGLTFAKPTVATSNTVGHVRFRATTSHCKAILSVCETNTRSLSITGMSGFRESLQLYLAQINVLRHKRSVVRAIGGSTGCH